MHFVDGQETVRVGPQGRIVVPARLRRELKLREGSVLLARADAGRLVLEPRSAAWSRLRALFEGRGEGRSLVDELIDEREAAADG